MIKACVLFAALALASATTTDHTVSPTSASIVLNDGTVIGGVDFSVDGSQLCADYHVDSENYAIVEAHAQTGDQQSSFPVDSSSGDRLYNFYDAQDHYCCNPVSSGSVCFPYEDCDSAMYVSIHLWVRRVNADGSVDESADPEHAWIEEKLRHVQINCPGSVSAGKHGCETFWARGTGDDNLPGSDWRSFTDLTGNPRWGWSNCIYQIGTYVYDIWAAAGQNDLNKGYHIGFLTVTVTADTVTFSFQGLSQCSDGNNNVINQLHVMVSQNSVANTHYDGAHFPDPVNPGGFMWKREYSSPVSAENVVVEKACDYYGDSVLPCGNSYQVSIAAPTADIPVCFQAHGEGCDFCSAQGTHYYS